MGLFGLFDAHEVMLLFSTSGPDEALSVLTFVSVFTLVFLTATPARHHGLLAHPRMPSYESKTTPEGGNMTYRFVSLSWGHGIVGGCCEISINAKR